MTKKYYLSIEIRYIVFKTDEDGDAYNYDAEKHLHSGIFDSFDDCAKFGNSFLLSQKWITEGKMGYFILNELNKRFNHVSINLTNGANIYIKVKTINVFEPIELNEEFSKFNVKKITKEL